MKLHTMMSVPCPHCTTPVPIWADADLTGLVHGKHLITGMRHAPRCPTCDRALFGIAATPAPKRTSVAVVVSERAAERPEAQRVTSIKVLLMLALSALLSGRFGQAAGHLYHALAQ